MGCCSSRESPHGKDLPEYGEEQLEWSRMEREDAEVYERCRLVWEKEDRSGSIEGVFQRLEHPAGHEDVIRLGLLHGIVADILVEFPDMYAMPSQNMSFLRQVPVEEVPPLNAVFITTPTDMASVLGEWMEPPMAKLVSQPQFAMCMELLLWVSSSEEFARAMVLAIKAREAPEPAPKSTAVVAIGSQSELLQDAPLGQEESKQQHQYNKYQHRGSASGSAGAGARNSGASDMSRATHDAADDPEYSVFESVVPSAPAAGAGAGAGDDALLVPTGSVSDDSGDDGSGSGSGSGSGARGRQDNGVPFGAMYVSTQPQTDADVDSTAATSTSSAGAAGVGAGVGIGMGLVVGKSPMFHNVGDITSPGVSLN